MSEVETPRIKAPTPLATELVRRILGFGVWVGVGLAPFLGRVRVPGFSALLDMYPFTLRGWLIPISGLLMGMTALVVEFAAGRRVPQRTLTRWFIRTVVLFAASFGLLLVLYLFLVVRVDGPPPPEGQGGEAVAYAVVTGGLEVPPQPPSSECECKAGETAEQCIGNVTLNPANVRRCFGSQRVALASLALAALYLALTGSFAAGVGLLLLTQRAGAKGRQPR
jgi:hypothetical protein